MTKFNFERVLSNIDKMKHDLPQVIANDALRFFNDAFIKQGWTDTMFEAWAPRKRNPRKRDLTRKILVDTGRLRRTVATSLRTVSFDRIRFVVDLPYAKVHNEGGTFTRSAHTRGVFLKSRVSSYAGLTTGKNGRVKMNRQAQTVHIRAGDRSIGAHAVTYPRRKFMGDSAQLRILQRKKIISVINTIWRG